MSVTELTRQINELRREVDALKRREMPAVAHALREATYRRSVQERISERVSLLDLIETSTERSALQNRESSRDISKPFNELLNCGKPGYVPAGDYIVSETYGSGRSVYSLMATYNNVDILLDPGARILVRDGAAVRPFIARDIEGYSFTGGDIIDQRTVKAGTGLALENCRRGFVHRMRIKDFAGYGIALTEDTSAPIISSNDFVFDPKTHRIYDPQKRLTDFRIGDRIYVSTTLNNNGIKNIIGSSGDGAWVEVLEPLVSETGGAATVLFSSNVVQLTASSDSAEVFSFSGGFLGVEANDIVQMSGWSYSGNNGAFVVTGVTADGLYISLAGVGFFSEIAGATISFSKVGSARLQVLRAKPCNDNIFTYNHVSGIKVIAYEMFAKWVSYGLLLLGNTAYNCGHGSSGGTGIKVGTNFTDLNVVSNRIYHCNNGVNIGNWLVHHYLANEVLNAEKFSYAITASRHPLSQDATYDVLRMTANVAAHINDFGPGTDGEPEIKSTPFVPSSTAYAGVNLNGLEPADLIDLDGFVLSNLSRGWTLDTCRARYPNLHIRNFVVNNCGGSGVIVLEFTGTATNGSNVISDLTNTRTGVVGTAGWFATSGFIARYFPDPTTVVGVDPVAGTITLDNVASGIGGAGSEVIAFYSGSPEGLDHSNNRYINSDVDFVTPSNNVDIQVYLQGRRTRSNNNIYQGYGAYCERVRGTDSILMNERFIECNPKKTATRGPMFFDPDFAGNGTGEYHAYDNFADLGRYQADGSNSFLYMISYNNTAGIHAHNNMASHPDVRPLYQTTAPVLPTLLGTVGNNRIWSATTPPASGNQVGDICYNPAPTTTHRIFMWIATGGSTWAAIGHGRGTTAQRPALTANDAGYRYDDTTIDREILWSGTAWIIRHEPRVLFTNTASRTVFNSTIETALNPTGVGTLALPANYYAVGSGTRYLYHGTIRTTGTPTLRLRLRTVSGVIVVDTGAITMPTLPVVSWRAECILTCRTAGSSGLVAGILNFTFNTGAGITVVNAIEAPPATATVDTTAAQTPYLSAEWGTASSLNSMVTQSLIAETLY